MEYYSRTLCLTYCSRFWIRIPNYADEQAIWISFYGYEFKATGLWVNCSVAGCVLLVFLFKGSYDFSEGVLAQKYPLNKNTKKKLEDFYRLRAGLKGKFT
jgi:steroid 5-alpha reductase family enzyme